MPGASAKCAPASAASRTWSGDSTVPAPTSIPSTARARRMASAAASVRNVTSMQFRPARTSARAVASAWSPSSTLVTGITRAAASRSVISDSAIVAVCTSVTSGPPLVSLSPLHAGRPLQERLEVLLARHRLGVPPRRDRTRAGAVGHPQAVLRRKPAQPAGQEPGDERVSCPYWIDDGRALDRKLVHPRTVHGERMAGGVHDELPFALALEEPLRVADLVTADQGVGLLVGQEDDIGLVERL